MLSDNSMLHHRVEVVRWQPAQLFVSDDMLMKLSEAREVTQISRPQVGQKIGGDSYYLARNREDDEGM